MLSFSMPSSLVLTTNGCDIGEQHHCVCGMSKHQHLATEHTKSPDVSQQRD